MSIRACAVLLTVLMLDALLGLGLDHSQATSSFTMAPARLVEVSRTTKLEISEKGAEVAPLDEGVAYWASPEIVLKSHSVMNQDEERAEQRARAAAQASKVPLSPDALAARRRLEADF